MVSAAPKTSRLARWCAIIALVVLFPALVLALLELSLRAAGFGFSSGFLVPVPGRSYWGTNEDFGRRFFPAAMARTPVPALISQPKPAGVYRIFILGESAAMGFPEPA